MSDTAQRDDRVWQDSELLAICEAWNPWLLNADGYETLPPKLKPARLVNKKGKANG